jgi:hypothetical protein
MCMIYTFRRAESLWCEDNITKGPKVQGGRLPGVGEIGGYMV